jgi:hypothetical protein
MQIKIKMAVASIGSGCYRIEEAGAVSFSQATKSISSAFLMIKG